MTKRRILTKSILQRVFKTFSFTGILKKVFGEKVETCGIWIIYGNEKSGKTTLALILANLLSDFEKTLYISGEQGIDERFQDTIKRVGIDKNNKKLEYEGWLEIEELDEILSNRQGPKIIIIDNLSVYVDEFKNGVLRKFTQKHREKLFIFMAHEDRNEPYTATAKLAKKLAKVIIRTVGLVASVSGRYNHTELIINEEKAVLYHGTEILKNTDHEKHTDTIKDYTEQT